jgi:uncharacterized protein (TIGR00369 family)
MQQDPQPGVPIGPRELEALMAEDFPQMSYLNIQVEEVRPRFLRMRVPGDERHLRPGGTISGPTMMALADCAVWLAIIATTGKNQQSVTSSFNMNFLRRPEPGDLVAECQLLKVGRRLAFGEVDIYSPGLDEPVAHATLAYALPGA